MTLTGKQKRVLRSRGQLLDPVVFVGKDGVDSAVASTETAFRRRELIKVRVLPNAPDTRESIASELAERAGAHFAGMVGHTFLLYRPNPEAKERIELPPAKDEER